MSAEVRTRTRGRLIYTRIGWPWRSPRSSRTAAHSRSDGTEGGLSLLLSGSNRAVQLKAKPISHRCAPTRRTAGHAQLQSGVLGTVSGAPVLVPLHRRRFRRLDRAERLWVSIRTRIRVAAVDPAMTTAMTNDFARFAAPSPARGEKSDEGLPCVQNRGNALCGRSRMRPVSRVQSFRAAHDVDSGDLVACGGIGPCRRSRRRRYVDQVVLILDEEVWCSELLCRNRLSTRRSPPGGAGRFRELMQRIVDRGQRHGTWRGGSRTAFRPSRPVAFGEENPATPALAGRRSRLPGASLTSCHGQPLRSPRTDGIAAKRGRAGRNASGVAGRDCSLLHLAPVTGRKSLQVNHYISRRCAATLQPVISGAFYGGKGGAALPDRSHM